MWRFYLPELVFHRISLICGRGYGVETATGLQTVVRGKQEHAPCETFSSKNPQDHGSKFCGHQLARWLGWAAPAYHEQGGLVGGVGVTVKEELCEKVLEVRRVSGRVMTCCF